MGNLSGLNIDKNVEEAGSNGKLLPKGRQLCVIAGSKVTKNSKKTGKILYLNLQVVKGEFKGVQKKDNLNIINKTKQAQEIAQGTLKRICRILDVEFPPDSSKELHGMPLEVDFGHKTFINEKDEEILVNKIEGYYEFDKLKNKKNEYEDEDEDSEDNEKEDDDEDDDEWDTNY